MKSFTQVVLDALAIPSAFAASTLIVGGWTRTPGGVRWSRGPDLTLLSEREAIAVHLAIEWSMSDDNPQVWLTRQRTPHEVAEMRLRNVREFLVALERPPCGTCRGTGSVLCEDCGHTGRDEDDDRCETCSGGGAYGCATCSGRCILPDDDVLVLKQKEQIAKARVEAAEKRLAEATEERDRLRLAHDGAYARLRRAEKTAGAGRVR